MKLIISNEELKIVTDTKTYTYPKFHEDDVQHRVTFIAYNSGPNIRIKIGNIEGFIGNNKTLVLSYTNKAFEEDAKEIKRSIDNSQNKHIRAILYRSYFFIIINNKNM